MPLIRLLTAGLLLFAAVAQADTGCVVLQLAPFNFDLVTVEYTLIPQTGQLIGAAQWHADIPGVASYAIPGLMTGTTVLQGTAYSLQFAFGNDTEFFGGQPLGQLTAIVGGPTWPWSAIFGGAGHFLGLDGTLNLLPCDDSPQRLRAGDTPPLAGLTPQR
jgi:hypothetical protein